jgi:hypothetical protein
MCVDNSKFGRQDGVDLKDFFEARMKDLRTLIETNDKNYNQRFDFVSEATKSALSASDRAVTKAEMATEKRFDAVNEFRSTLADQQRNFIPRAEVTVIVKSVTDRLEKLENYQLVAVGTAKGTGVGWSYVIGGIGVVSLVVSLILNFVKLGQT